MFQSAGTLGKVNDVDAVHTTKGAIFRGVVKNNGIAADKIRLACQKEEKRWGLSCLEEKIKEQQGEYVRET